MDVELLLNGEPSDQEPSADALVRWFGEEHDPTDFLILRDESLGELRATAPQDGVCLVCREGSEAAIAASGEAELSQADAARIFVEFLSGDRALFWAGELRREEPPFTWFGWIFGALATALAWWSWRFF